MLTQKGIVSTTNQKFYSEGCCAMGIESAGSEGIGCGAGKAAEKHIRQGIIS